LGEDRFDLDDARWNKTSLLLSTHNFFSPAELKNGKPLRTLVHRLYAGTKHSTVTALGKIMSPEQIKHNVTGHTSNAIQRYFLPDHNEKISATRMVTEM